MPASFWELWALRTIAISATELTQLLQRWARPKVTLDSRLDSVGDWRCRALQGVERSSSPGTAGNSNSCSFFWGGFQLLWSPLSALMFSALEGACTSQLALWKLLISIPFPYRSLKREERKSKNSYFSFSLLTSFQQTFVSPTCVHNNGYNPVVIYEPVKWGFAPASVNCLSICLHAKISGCARDPFQPQGFLASVPLLLLTVGVSGTLPAVDLVLSSPVAKTILLMRASEPELVEKPGLLPRSWAHFLPCRLHPHHVLQK